MIAFLLQIATLISLQDHRTALVQVDANRPNRGTRAPAPGRESVSACFISADKRPDRTDLRHWAARVFENKRIEAGYPEAFLPNNIETKDYSFKGKQYRLEGPVLAATDYKETDP